jgi:hypothetical protein
MDVSQIRAYLKDKGSVQPPEPAAYEEWLEFIDALEFLVYSATGHIPVYLSSKYFYLYAVIVPRHKMKGDYVADLMQWNFSVSAGW